MFVSLFFFIKRQLKKNLLKINRNYFLHRISFLLTEKIFKLASFLGLVYTKIDIKYRDVAQFGSAPVLGTGSRRFESCHPESAFSSVGRTQVSKT